MFVETSAIVAILADEPEAGTLLAQLENARTRETGAHVRPEATINLARILGLEVTEAHDLYDGFLAATEIAVIPITDAVARRAVEAFATHGKGRGHPAQLNFGDCLSDACAIASGAPMLFKGRDFSKTDLKAVDL